MTSIPASAIVNVLPAVISAGGSGLDIIGLMLTDNEQIPVGTKLAFASAADVSVYFGPLSTEATLAAIYFAGYDGSTIKPASLLFWRYATADVAGYVRGGSVADLTLAELQALTGTLTLTVGGTEKTSAAIDLSGASSFSNAASIIEAAFTTPNFAVTYDSISGGFVFTSDDTGASATFTFVSGTLATELNLTEANGAVLSQGADQMVPGTAMAEVISITQDFVSFMTTFEPSDADKLLLSAWVDAQNQRYLYVAWDDNVAAKAAGDTSSFLALAIAEGYGSVAGVYDPNNGASVAAFLMGAIASIDFNTTNGRATLAFRSGSVNAGVTNQTIAANLKANGYNFVGAYATANDQFVFLYPGQVTGDFEWIDSWVCQVWMNNAFQLALMELLTSVGSIPYNQDGYALIEASLRSVIDTAVNFGAIRAGVTLSAQQKAEINNAAGGNVADTVEQRGWFVQVADANPTVRAARGSPPIFVWYTDGQSVQQITLSSVLVQ
ncbi:hypothetical protein GCM10011349_19900 [Novosphingobium indicum]|uniref:DUF3383 domain-containing protein n=1 Tax=Novosphingobium indicum TaxID=462949 RepID=A0ABQ2JP60_9SPHN|nr:DUF3383 domain-containing protein [Novosphingobium indicum]GGN49344.1 hypothetical protein GCM10011349_19900 [Novosphingobium indicum]